YAPMLRLFGALWVIFGLWWLKQASHSAAIWGKVALLCGGLLLAQGLSGHLEHRLRRGALGVGILLILAGWMLLHQFEGALGRTIYLTTGSCFLVLGSMGLFRRSPKIRPIDEPHSPTSSPGDEFPD
ncbi:MAG: hypothetical protein ACK4OO_03170, partial [bacterium]